jgi:site-specific DNA-cytosine methylase
MHKINENAVYIDLGFIKYTRYPNSHIYSPCLNTQGELWNNQMHRFANIKEYLSLQGFPSDFKQVVNDNQMKKQIGNSMSVDVLVQIFRIFYTQI